MARRVKTSAVLRYARDRIKTSEMQYICLAVEEYAGWEEMPAVNRTLRVIRTRMQMKQFEKWVDKQRELWRYDWDVPSRFAETSLEWWLVWKGYRKLQDRPTNEQMRQYRLAWLDELIKEFEAKGD